MRPRREGGPHGGPRPWADGAGSTESLGAPSEAELSVGREADGKGGSGAQPPGWSCTPNPVLYSSGLPTRLCHPVCAPNALPSSLQLSPPPFCSPLCLQWLLVGTSLSPAVQGLGDSEQALDPGSRQEPRRVCGWQRHGGQPPGAPYFLLSPELPCLSVPCQLYSPALPRRPAPPLSCLALTPSPRCLWQGPPPRPPCAVPRAHSACGMRLWQAGSGGSSAPGSRWGAAPSHSVQGTPQDKDSDSADRGPWGHPVPTAKVRDMTSCLM